MLFRSERPRPWAAEDVRVVRAVPREIDLVAVLDLSLSISGETLALVATAAAVLRLRLERLAVVAFDTRARTLVRIEETVPPRELVRRILEVSAEGYTNLEAGLEAAARELRRSVRRERAAFVLTDGVANVGRDPVVVARRLPRLHVVHLGGHHPQGARTCQAMATEGRGRLYRARTFEDLPQVVRRAARELVRHSGQ